MYGSVDGVAAIASTWTRNGEFFDEDLTYEIEATNPPLAIVEAWLETMSTLMDAALSSAFFVVPVADTYTVSYSAIGTQVNLLVAAMVAARNSHDANNPNSDETNWKKIQDQVTQWVKDTTEAFIAEGVAQITDNPIRAGQTAVILQDDE